MWENVFGETGGSEGARDCRVKSLNNKSYTKPIYSIQMQLRPLSPLLASHSSDSHSDPEMSEGLAAAPQLLRPSAVRTLPPAQRRLAERIKC